MKITRENDVDDVFFKFRMSLSFRKFDLMKEFLDANFGYRTNKTKSRVIVIIDIENAITPESIKTVLKNYKLKSKDFDIFIGITSSYDMGG